MRKEVLNFVQKYGILTVHLIVGHLQDIGQRAALAITDEDLENFKAKLESEEQAAQAEGKISLMTPDFQIGILKGCRELAQLSENRELTHDVNLLIAQSLVPMRDLLAEMDFKDIQGAYWTNVVTQYVESLCDDEERKEALEALEDNGTDEIVEYILNDDEVWKAIDDSIDYHVRLLF